MKKSLCATLLAIFFFCCGPQLQPSVNSYFNYRSEELKISDTQLVPFDQIKAPNYDPHEEKRDKKDLIAETALNWRLGNYDFPRPYPYLVSAAPYYCDPQRFPPSLVLGMYACLPYIPQIMQIGFYHSQKPGF